MARQQQMQFSQFEHLSRLERFAQFKGKSFKSGQTFTIGVGDASVLKSLSTSTVTLPGWSASDAQIATRIGGAVELWLNPQLSDYRDAHFAFFSEMGIILPAGLGKLYDSDHAFPKSAAKTDAGLVLMSFIDKGANRSFGAGWEKRNSHRSVDDNGLVRGNIVDLLKSMGIRLPDQKDLPGSIKAIPQLLIAAGLADASSRKSLDTMAEAALSDWQDWDELYAYLTGQG